MSLEQGARLGPYEITAKLGEGGMGEVWRARDTKLEREVAIKVLPAAFVEDHERLARFEREAKLLAQLNHPNIAQIYGLEASGESHALVMELVEGPTLAERLEPGALPLSEVLSIAKQIAEALEEAHEKGIVHRDLKPQNVKASIEGKIKVLDFGLAKAMDSTGAASGAGSASQLAASPTLTLGATVQGVILGTAAYMAPEQARGTVVDKRADIWAFGVVLYEMLAGRAAFAADTLPDTLAAVLTREIDWSRLPPETPPAIRRLLRRCLERNPGNRLHDIADARLELDAADEEPAVVGTATTAPPTTKQRALWSTGVVVAVALGALAGWLLKPGGAHGPAWKLSLAPPSEIAGFRVSPRISPDGRSLAYLADGKLWVQELGSLTPRAVPKGEEATALTWSPDSASLAFAARSQIYRTLPSGDTAVVAKLTEAIQTDSGGLAWTTDGTIVFSTGHSGLQFVPVVGGSPRSLLEPDPTRDKDFHQVLALPGGAIAFIVHSSSAVTDSVDLFAGGERRTMHRIDNGFLQGLAWSPSGHLLVANGQRSAGVWAVPLAAGGFEPAGEPFLVMADVGSPSVSNDGILLLSSASGVGEHQLTLVDRSGGAPLRFGDPTNHADHATFSPDGRRVAICAFEGKDSSVWIYDLERDSRSRLWSNIQCGGSEGGITWSSDGERIAFSESESKTIRSRRADGTDEERTITEGIQPHFGPDGRWLVFTRASEETGKDLWAMRPPDAETVRPFLATPALEEHPQISPDGRFVAYVSDVTGRREIHLKRFPDGQGQWQVSDSGGVAPRWSRDGKRLFFLQSDQMMEVEVRLQEIPLLSDPRHLFSAAAALLGPDHGYDPSPDGERFVTVALGSLAGLGGDLTLISPWPPDTTSR